jgi:membrane protein YqaA with SNARE-associated domain
MTHKRITIPLILASLLIALVVWTGFETVEKILSPDIFAVTSDKFLNDTFVRVGILVIFFYELIPFTFRFITDSGFFAGLIQEGVNPFALILITALGKLVGYYILYMIGRGVSRVLRGRDKELAGAEHVLHQYKFFVFVAVPFLGSLGDLVVLIAGHERIGFLKIAPLLFVSSILRISIWIFPFMAQLNLVDIL